MAELDDFVPGSHPLRPIRIWLNDALKRMDPVFARMYESDAKGGRPSIAPEKLIRALLLQALYSIRSEHVLMEKISCTMLFRRFVRLEMEVVRLFVFGFSANEIAERLHPTKQTVSAQKCRAMRKLGTARDADLFQFAYETGLIAATHTPK